MTDVIHWWWSCGLASAGLLSMWLIAHGRRAGWVIGLLMQFAWFTYAVTSQQWGFAVSSTAFAVINAHGLRVWRRRRATTCRCVGPGPTPVR